MDKHMAIVFGEKHRVLYYADRYNGEIGKISQLIERVVLFEGAIDNPVLQVKEKIYLKDKNLTVTVTDIARNVEGGYAYRTEHIVEKIEDNKTEESKIQAEKDSVGYIETKRVRQETRDKEEAEKNKKWYQKLFIK